MGGRCVPGGQPGSALDAPVVGGLLVLNGKVRIDVYVVRDKWIIGRT